MAGMHEGPITLRGQGMKAVVWNRGFQFVEDYPVPEPGDGEALVRVLMAGICNTDLEIAKGYMGFTGIPGHEFVGVIERPSAGGGPGAGTRVVGEINCGCGACEYCLRGMKTHCPSRKTIGIVNKDGAFAEYLTLPGTNLHEAPQGVSDEEAVFTEPLAAAFEITDQVHVRPTDRILVMGDGKLGLLSAFVLGLTEAHVTLAGKHEEKLDIARARGIDASPVHKLTQERIYDVVVEATGRADGIETALRLVKPRGTVVLKSTVAERKAIDLTPIVIDEVRVQGSRCGPFGPALRALSSGLIDVKPLITGVFPFAKAREALERAGDGVSLKTIIDFRSRRRRG
jgi:alcohol dehydrogenase